MPPSETNIPSRDGGRDSASIDNGKRRNGNVKSFDLEAFHQLRLERVENQRRSEQRIREMDERRSRRRWNSIVTTSSSIDSSTEVVQTKPSRSSSSSSENNAVDKLLARQELLRLGKRYDASTPSLRQMRLHSENVGTVNNMARNVEALISPSTYGISTNRDSEIGGSSVALGGGVSNPSLQSLDEKSRSSSVPMETLSCHDSVSVVVPDENNTSGEGIGVYSSQYLLLARNNPSPAIKSNNLATDNGITLDADDGSCSASLSTPTPQLQAASACNSHGEIEDGHDDQQCHQRARVDGETDHLSSFCKAQVMISEIQGSTSEQLDTVSMCSSVPGSTQSHRRNAHRILQFVAQLAVVSIAGAVIFVFSRFVMSWHNLASLPARINSCLDLIGALTRSLKATLNVLFFKTVTESLSLSAHLTSRLMELVKLVWCTLITRCQAYFTTLGAIWVTLFAKIAGTTEQAQSLLGRFTSLLTSCAKVAWRNPIAIYTGWVKDVNILSWIIENMYRLEKRYYDALEIFETAKCKSLEVSSLVAWNATLSVAISCWQNLKSVPLSHLFCRSEEHIVIEKSTLTAPVCPNGRCPSLANETFVLLDSDDDAKTVNESSPPPFWRMTPFVRNQLPSTTLFHRPLHSIPSYSDSLATQWHIWANPTINGLHHPDKGSNSFALVGLSRSRLSFDSLRLESVVVCSDLRKNIAALTMMQKSSPLDHVGGIPRTQTSQAITAIKERNYYLSSYPVNEKSHKKDVFDDVDVMGMARQFIGQVLKRRSSKKGRRRKVLDVDIM